MKRFKVLFFFLIFAALITVVTILAHGHNLWVLQPQGTIAAQERHLIIITTLLSLIVVIPVFILTIAIVLKYRVENTKATYSPEWDHSKILETIWWLVPTAIILVLAVITWKSTYALDPYKPLSSKNPPLTIQVIALDWKWLFIYPEQHIATINYVQFPENTPINFEITSDAPMNSFWIPQLGSQIYAMPGMQARVYLMANGVGTYPGASANISGAGFAGMAFMAHSLTQTNFNQWVTTTQQTPSTLTMAEYNKLLQPSTDNPVASFSGATTDIYGTIMMKYMEPSPTASPYTNGSMPDMSMPGMDMQGMNMDGMN